MRPAGASTPENSLGTVAAVASQAEADGDALRAIGEPAHSEVVSAQIRNREHRAILISNNPWLSPGEAMDQATKSALAGGYRASLHENVHVLSLGNEITYRSALEFQYVSRFACRPSLEML